MKTLLLGLAALPFLAGVALAAEPLKDAQMDQITGGATCPANFTCTSSTVGTTMTNFGCLSGPNGCNGQVFTPTSPQAFYADLVTFLNQVGYKPGP
jgi:hypothetical protein